MPHSCHFYGIEPKVKQVIKTRDLLNAFWDIRALFSNFGKRPLAPGKNWDK